MRVRLRGACNTTGVHVGKVNAGTGNPRPGFFFFRPGCLMRPKAPSDFAPRSLQPTARQPPDASSHRVPLARPRKLPASTLQAGSPSWTPVSMGTAPPGRFYPYAFLTPAGHMYIFAGQGLVSAKCRLQSRKQSLCRSCPWDHGRRAFSLTRHQWSIGRLVVRQHRGWIVKSLCRVGCAYNEGVWGGIRRLLILEFAVTCLAEGLHDE